MMDRPHSEIGSPVTDVVAQNHGTPISLAVVVALDKMSRASAIGLVILVRMNCKMPAK